MAEGVFPAGSELAVEVFAGELLQAHGHHAALGDYEFVVHENQRLRGHGGDGALGAVGLHGGRVEGVEEGELARAAYLHVKAAAEFFALEVGGLTGLAFAVEIFLADDKLADLVLHHRHGLAADFHFDLAAN